MTLLQKEFFSAGTVRMNGKNLPKSDQLQSDVFFIPDGWSLYNKPVHMLSNFLAAHHVQKVKRQMENSSEEAEVKCPFVIQEYNKHIRDVELMDHKKVC